MALKRYFLPDEYTTAEIESIYESRTPVERVAFLEDLHKEYGKIPEPAIECALKDTSTWVRAKLADFPGALSFRDPHEEADEFVRATSYENSDRHLNPVRIIKDVVNPLGMFKKLSNIEQLAFMRSRFVPKEIVYEVFDENSKALELEPRHRGLLVCAFLSGKSHPVVEQDSEQARFRPVGEKLWNYASQWEGGWLTHEDFSVQAMVFAHIRAPDNLRRTMLTKFKDRQRRFAVLETASDRSQSIQMMLSDDDDDVRGYSWSRISFSSDNTDDIEALMNGDDLAALRGLAVNTNVSEEVRVRASLRLGDLGDKYWKWDAFGGEQVKSDEPPVRDNALEEIKQSLRQQTEQIAALGRAIRGRSVFLLVVIALTALILAKSC